jgi:predicted unusual protein kinase regulating ubiquinone biosynthesis (AarF/ABC1/UbiB family)
MTDIPRRAVSRSAKLAALPIGFAGRAALGLGKRVTGLASEVISTEVQQRTAEHLFSVLGQLKGGAMKFGQALSVFEAALPEDLAGPYRAALTRLQEAAPPLPAASVHKAIAAEFGADWRDRFLEFDDTPAAAASIGQVHRAVWADGRVVAVKIQYPGVAQALRADMQNAGMILRLAKALAPGLDAKAAAEELKERVLEELDYEYEAQNQRTFARAYRGHPFIYVPDVISRLTTERVLVTEWVDGLGFEEIKELPQDKRDRFGEIVFRFCFGSIYHLQHFNADAHPGNYVMMLDGKVAFLDFGMTKQLDKEQIELEIAALEAVFDNDPEGLVGALHDLGFLRNPKRIDAVRMMEHVKAVGGWYMDDRDLTIDSERVMQAISAVSDPRSDFYDLMRRENVPANELMGRRMESGVLAVLGQLNATRNWYRIGREWWFAEEPATELGEQEWEFFESRGERRVRKFGARAG